jgi:hypothetical protein
MTIVTYVHRPKRAQKRKHPVVIPMRIVTAKKTKPAAATMAVGEAVTERKPAQAVAIRGPRIVTARKMRGRFGDVPDMTAEEYEQRGDAAVALFKEIVRRLE